MDTWLINLPGRGVVMCRLENCKLQCGEGDCLIYGHKLDLVQPTCLNVFLEKYYVTLCLFPYINIVSINTHIQQL